ncbi:MAG: sulfurtransferase TusA family protein [Magnetococcales bacterium]|nr:sulfurtransferase TusA family protein [Magnetococcales bacterium]
MAIKELDAKGLKTQQLLLNITFEISSMQPGDILKVVSDIATFEDDVTNWCNKNNKTIKQIEDMGRRVKQCEILA